jgi:hypothetical protein
MEFVALMLIASSSSSDTSTPLGYWVKRPIGDDHDDERDHLASFADTATHAVTYCWAIPPPRAVGHPTAAFNFPPRRSKTIDPFRTAQQVQSNQAGGPARHGAQRVRSPEDGTGTRGGRPCLGIPRPQP